VIQPTLKATVKMEGRDVFDRLGDYDRFLTAKELARILAISEKTIYTYVSKKMIPYYKIESNVRFRAKDIATWLNRRAVLAV